MQIEGHLKNRSDPDAQEGYSNMALIFLIIQVL